MRRAVALAGLMPLSFAAALLLAACDGGSGVGADGYRFGHKEKQDTELEISVVVHNTRNEVLEAAEDAGVTIPQSRVLMAWGELRGSACTIHIISPEVAYEPEWLGHELAHCIWGRWHP